ncbi:MAG: preprotein translocase subunit SecA [Candidatus Peribacteraceae bacterium]|nr:preprotein translocase subunit SecA [Candidatus Peribacteraceae bacterium]
MDSLNKLLGDPNKKELNKLWPMVKDVRTMQATPAIAALTLDDLPKKTQEFKDRVAKGESLDSILPEAFATAIRACELLVGSTMQIGQQTFTWDMIPFDVQILGGIALHRGCIGEMRTGEGKTLVCTLPVYLNALTGKGVHVVTVNDYLAKRDATWMGLLYKALGLTVGIIVHGIPHDGRKEAYAADVTYGTNNEFGFDYLRDNMSITLERQVQRTLHYAIVDEVDSILIDEARTPLIISQPAGESTGKYSQYAQYVTQLQPEVHFQKDEKQRAATLTEEGIRHMEQLLGVENIYTERGFEEVHHIEQALKAHAIFQRDVDYVVKEGEIIIVDEFTGRLMPGRRYSHGLHQAIEAKEGVEVQRESKTLATITFQNYFRLYEKLAGMTGTAKTEEEEFQSIYKLDTIVIPTHRNMVRADKADAVYRTVKAKFEAVASIAKERHEKGQPVLIGTTSIEKSEAMSFLLTDMKIPHVVLNAKQHDKEADIVANAGQKGTITIATNMAGRGTDIKLGEGVKELGGLVILGTERHEARRIDNQLRGRAGRQGDPGESQFFVSMEDELMRLFGGDRLKSMMERLNVPEDVPLENGMVSRSIESAQKKVEGRNFDTRRHVVQYDDVMNKHREIMYKRRQKLLVKIYESQNQEQKNGEPEANHELRITNYESAGSLHQDVFAAIEKEIDILVTQYASADDSENWQLPELLAGIATLHPQLPSIITLDQLKLFGDTDKLKEAMIKTISSFYEEKCKQYDAIMVSRAEQILILQAIDMHWMDHIDTMAHLREQVAFSGYAQRDPLIEYQDQGFRLFQKLLLNIDATMVRALLQTDFNQFAAPRVMLEANDENLQTNADQIESALQTLGAADEVQEMKAQPQKSADKVGRNDPCPCGSGKKYKKCHGINE